MWDLKPSETQHLLELLESEIQRNDYFENLMKDGLVECDDHITLIDDYWVYGIIHRQALNMLSIRKIEALDSIETNKARCFMNGYRGLDWNDGLML